MRNSHSPRPHTTAYDRVERSSRAGLSRLTRGPSIQLISDGVTAGYLHDISQRHHFRSVDAPAGHSQHEAGGDGRTQDSTTIFPLAA